MNSTIQLFFPLLKGCVGGVVWGWGGGGGGGGGWTGGRGRGEGEGENFNYHCPHRHEM